MESDVTEDTRHEVLQVLLMLLGCYVQPFTFLKSAQLLTEVVLIVFNRC